MVTHMHISGSCEKYQMDIACPGFSMSVTSLSADNLVTATRIVESEMFKNVRTLVVTVILVDDVWSSQGLFDALENFRTPDTIAEVFFRVFKDAAFVPSPVFSVVKYHELVKVPNSACYFMCEFCGAFAPQNNFSHHANVEICLAPSAVLQTIEVS